MNTLVTLVCAIALLLLIAILWRQRREHQRILNDLPTGLCIVSGDRKIQRWNAQMQSLSGIAVREAVGTSIDQLPKPWNAALADALDTGSDSVTKQMLTTPDTGKSHWVLLHSGRKGPGGQRQVLVEDVTEYQHLQDELLHQERLASVGRLAAGVAHEIGNPVTGIACVAQNLAASADAAELEQGTSEILKQTDRISRMVNALMQLSHPGSANRDAQFVPCNLADCIDEAIHLLNLDVDSAPQQFENHCDRELLVCGDSQLLLQVFLNLLDNARSAAPADATITLNARVNDGRVLISIDNPGPIVPADILSQVFEPFFTTKDVGEGTGLGLALVRSTVEDMNGFVSLKSPIPDGDGDGTQALLDLEQAHYGDDYGDRYGDGYGDDNVA